MIRKNDFDHLKKQCACCYKIVMRDQTIILPTTTGYRFCYPCFVSWYTDYPKDVFQKKIEKWWVNPEWEATGD